MIHSGRHFLQIPGPTNVPDRVLRAMDRAVIDHRGPEFAALTREILEGVRRTFQTSGAVVVFPSSGTGACEAALVNTLSPGDRVLIFETGWFSHIAWRKVAENVGLRVEYVPGTWRRGVAPADVEARLAADARHEIAAVIVVHNETSTGATSRIGEIRAAMNRAGHPALLIVDAISSLASIEYRHDEWQVDVTVSCSQKGLMVPPGLGLNAISQKALTASRTARSLRSYWSWEDMLR
jgi:alanine-glyoxylate transaminase/serine-glyoxylate transaminase/serine-pyruvate transaminase